MNETLSLLSRQCYLDMHAEGGVVHSWTPFKNTQAVPREAYNLWAQMHRNGTPTKRDFECSQALCNIEALPDDWKYVKLPSHWVKIEWPGDRSAMQVRTMAKKIMLVKNNTGGNRTYMLEDDDD